MCGICGFTGLSGGYGRETLRVMMDAQRHRGPDDSGTYSDDGISLGHRRLGIIDLQGGHQPVSNENGDVALVFNGEIYNFRDLRRELEALGHDFSTLCDSEVIVHAYEEWGGRCVERLNGMFAFALWDATKSGRRELLLARDRLGIKPLHYILNASAGGDIAFASEIRALLAGMELPRVLNRRAFHEFINFRFTLNETTLIDGIRKLPPAHTLRLTMENGNITGIKKERYWTLRENLQAFRNDELAVKRTRELLEEAVRMRLMSDVPLGVYLSGGIDSSSILSIMAAQRTSNDDILSFSVGFGDLPNELGHARTAAEAAGSTHHEFHVEPEAVIKNIGEIFYCLDEPVADPAVVPTYFISEFTRSKATVVLTGEGADELFGGYLRYRLALRANEMALKLGALRRHLSLLGKIMPAHWNYQRHLGCLSSGDLPGVYFNTTGLFLEKEQSSLFTNGSFARTDERRSARADVSRLFNGFRTASTLNKMLYMDITCLLPNDFLVKIDRMTMAHSIEGRVPFLDHRLVEHSMTLPDRLKIDGRNGKVILKKAVKGLVPDEIILRKKRGYNVPFDVWFKEGLGDMIEERVVRNRSWGGNPVFEPYYAGKLLRRLRRGGAGLGDRNYDRNWFTAQKLWAMLNFEMWRERYGVEPGVGG